MAEDSSQVITQLPAGTIPLSNFTPVPSATPVSPGMRQLVVQPGQPTPMASQVPAQDNATPVPIGTPGENTVTVTLPPGTIPVPANSSDPSDEALIRSAGIDPAAIQSSPWYQDDVKKFGSLGGVIKAHRTPLSDDKGLLTPGYFSDLTQGVQDTLSGLVQLARHGAGSVGILSDADVAYGDLLDRLSDQDYLQNIRKGQASPALIHLGQFLFPVPGVGKAKTIAGMVMRGGLHGAMAGAEMPVETGQPDDYFRQKLGQVGVGATVGATIPAVVGGAAQIPSLVRGAQLLPEDVAANTAAKFESKMGATPWTGLPEVQRAAAAGDKQAAQVVDAVTKASTPGEITQASIQLQNWATAQQASGLYGQVDRLVGQYGLGPAPLSGTQSALNAAEREARVGLQDRGLNSMLQDTRNALTPSRPAAPVPSGLVTPAGQPIAAAAAPAPGMQANYATARKVISQLDDAIREGHSGDGALITDRGTAQLQQVKNALEDDVQRFVSSSGRPDVQAAQHAADDYYRTVRVPFKDPAIAQAGSTDQSTMIWRRFVQADNPDKATKLYNALDARGRAGLQYQMLTDQVQKATDPVKGFDAGKFSRGMDKLQDAYGVAFTGQDQTALDGMRNLVLQAAKIDANPASVASNLVPHGGWFVSWIPRSEKVLRYMMASPSGRKFLYSAAGFKPGTPGMQNVLQQVEAAAAKWATAPSVTGTNVQ
jgi:hypothetical protein